jgi:UDP-N-acetylglucosamine acyltransferase
MMADVKAIERAGADIHPTAIIEPGARLGERVRIGPYSIVGANVVLGDDVELVSHVVVAGHTTIGEKTKVYPFASLGHPPQDLKYKGEPTRLVIGSNNVIREHVTMNPGTAGGGMLTQVGSHGLFMVGVHVAHDCRVGDYVVMVNNATLGGHVHVGDFAILGGVCAVHQFVRIGPYAMIGGMSGVESDVIPFGLVMGDRARLSGLNIVGLKRRGFSREDIHNLRTAYRLLFAQEGTMAERLEDVAGLYSKSRPVMDLVEFIREDSARAICQPKPSQGD